MNTHNIIKTVAISATAATLALSSSCTPIDPAYEAFKKQQAQAQVTATKTPQATNPYGAPSANNNPNPYAVPGNNGETGAPYQSIPEVQNTPPIVQNLPTPDKPYTPLPPEPSGIASSHTVIKGDTIWGLSRKYNVTGDDIRQANSLTSDTIWVGQKLVIPTR